MHFLRLCLLLVALIAIVSLVRCSPIDEEIYAGATLPEAQALLEVDTQGHENEGARLARQFGYGRGFGRGFGGYRGGFGGYRGGYGGFGGYRGGYGGYRRGGYFG